jgi:hypothetical protein
MNGFPVRCRTVRRSALGEGEDDPLKKVLEKAGQDLSDAIVEAVIKQCAFSLSLNIALMFIPVLGQAIAGLIAVVQLIAGKKYEKDTQKVIKDASDDIKIRAEASSAQVKAAAQEVYLQELPAAQLLAMSAQPLDGLGKSLKKAVSRVGSAISRVGSAFDDAVHSAVRGVSQALAKAEDKVKEEAAKLEDQARVIAKNPEAQLKFITSMSPVGLLRLGIKYTGNIVGSVAKKLEDANIVGEGDLTKPLREAREHIDENLYTAQKLTNPLTSVQEGTRLTAKHGGELLAKVAEAAGDDAWAADLRKQSAEVQRMAKSVEAALIPIGTYNLLTGRETYVAAKEACARMRAQAFAEIDAMRIAAIAKFQSPQGRLEMRKSIARYLRQDPAFLAYMEKIRILEEAERDEYAKLLAQEQASLNVLAQNARPTTNAGAGTFVGIAAAVAAAFTFSR